MRQAIGAALLLTVLAVSACAAPSGYMGIPFDPPVASTDSLPDRSLSHTARLAQSRNKHAQLALGIRFEEGRGIARDPDKAAKLYRLAGSDSGGVIWVYSSPVGNGPSGRVIPIDTGPRQPGLPEAKRRLERLESRERLTASIRPSSGE